jgi:hypothetical protein
MFQLHCIVINDLVDLRADLVLLLMVQDHGHHEQCRRTSDSEHTHRA